MSGPAFLVGVAGVCVGAEILTAMPDCNGTTLGSSAGRCPGSISDGAPCALDGSDNYHSLDLTYHSKTGIFRGTITSNLCSNNHYGYCALCDPPGYKTGQHTASCVTQTLPAVTGPAALGRGRVALTATGVNMYGPNEAGFGTGNFPKPCTDGTGTCPAGMDVPTCEDSLDVTCGDSSKVEHGLMLDTCGGHAMPYHYHTDNACDYDHSMSGHSPLVGFGLDGVGIYGLYEDNPSKPSDLDACNGHFATVPENNKFGVTTGVAYHYHVTSWAPYTLGCYGDPKGGSPVTQDQCKQLYPANSGSDTRGGCNDGVVSVTTSDHETYCYDLDCPCFDGRTSRLGRNTEDTSCLSSGVEV